MLLFPAFHYLYRLSPRGTSTTFYFFKEYIPSWSKLLDSINKNKWNIQVRWDYGAYR